jgi:ATP-dependent RNA helicase DDX5/DBP2
MSNLGANLQNIDWSKQSLPHFEKNFYIEDKRVTERSEREVEDFRATHGKYFINWNSLLYIKCTHLFQ